jgi:predicted GIY-YIG superfamily endonuclease
MKHLLYKLTDPNGKSYYGVTNNFKRRMKEHRKSPWAIGKALREFGEENFTMSFEEFETREKAFEREFELVSPETLEDLYNMSVGGAPHEQMLHSNPMKDPTIAGSHPNIWTKDNNPMNCEASKTKMIANQKRKPVSIDGVSYPGVREAARVLGESRQMVVHRLKSSSFPTWFYL